MAKSFHEVDFSKILGQILNVRLEIDVREEFKDRVLLRAAIGVPDGLPPETVSISHTPLRGGYARAAVPVGFDLEEVDRVKREAVARVSSTYELASAPSISLLWCAKEAGFKLLRGAPGVLSAVHVGAWQSAGRMENLSLWSCKIDEDRSSIGVAVELSGTALCLFVRTKT